MKKLFLILFLTAFTATFGQTISGSVYKWGNSSGTIVIPPLYSSATKVMVYDDTTGKMGYRPFPTFTGGFTVGNTTYQDGSVLSDGNEYSFPTSPVYGTNLAVSWNTVPADSNGNITVPVDTTPTSGSNALVTSGGVFTGLAGKFNNPTGTSLQYLDGTGTPKNFTSSVGITEITGVSGRTTIAPSGTTRVVNIDPAYDTARDAFATSAANAKVADAINDGTTTIAPSQNAVFDALALKERAQLPEKGLIIQPTTGLTGYTAGANWTGSGTTLTSTSGSDDYTQSANKVAYTTYGGTKLRKYTFTANHTIPTISSTTYGFSFATDGSRAIQVKFCEDSGSSRGQIKFYWNGTLVYTSPMALTINSGDVTNVKVVRMENRFTAIWTNTTTPGQISVPYEVPSAQGVLPPNYGNFSLWAHSVVSVSNFTVVSNELVGADILVVTDSEGTSQTLNSKQSFIAKMNEQTQAYVLGYIGNSDKIEDNNPLEIASHNPKNIIFYCVTNNIGAGESTSTVMTKLNNFVSTMAGLGWDYLDANNDGKGLYIANATPRTDFDVTPYNTAIRAQYPDVIDEYSAFRGIGTNPVTLWFPDGLHKNEDGHLQEAILWIEYLRAKNLIKYKNNFNPFTNYVFTDSNGRVNIGSSANTYAARGQLQLSSVAGLPELYFPSSTTNGMSIQSLGTGGFGIIGGGYLNAAGSVLATSTVFSGIVSIGNITYFAGTTSASAGTAYPLSSASGRVTGYIDNATKRWYIIPVKAYNAATISGSTTTSTGLSTAYSYNYLGTLTAGNGTVTSFPSSPVATDQITISNANTSTSFLWSLSVANAKYRDGTTVTTLANNTVYTFEYETATTSWVTNVPNPATANLQRVTMVSAAYTILPTDYYVELTTGTFTLTLPTAVGVTGKEYVIKNGNTGVLTIATTSSQTIDGSTTKTFNSQYSGIRVISNGTNWRVNGSF